MLLSALLANYFQGTATLDFDVQRLILDSRKVQADDVFIALKGTQVDGRKFIADALAKGAKAVLQEADSSRTTLAWQGNIPILSIPDLAVNLGKLAALLRDEPAKKLTMIGVTGTNGKTSCTHFIAQILSSLSIRCGVIGTLGAGELGALSLPGLTTPDAITLQNTLHDFVVKGIAACAMEVSSHSIAQGRINGIPFDVGVFTNLTQDHLDYHGDMATYASVKHQFLADSMVKKVVINGDDGYGREWLQQFSSDREVYIYQTVPQKHTDFPTLKASNVALSLSGIQAEISSPWGEGLLSIPLIGAFNLSNTLAVLTTLCLQGIPFDQALPALSALQSVPGRMQVLGGHGLPVIVVDFAHTPDALEKTLSALAAHTKGKLICVFGCGGNRDPLKRPLMAKIAEQYARQIIVTNDNPRHEKPIDIVNEILRGFAHPERILIELDRSKAIQKSIQWATAKDCVLIAGKGAEHYQQIGDEKLPFDDVTEVRRYLNEVKAHT